MFYIDPITGILIGLILFLLLVAITGSVIYVWIMAVPLIPKIIWTISMVALAFITVVSAIMVID